MHYGSRFDVLIVEFSFGKLERLDYSKTSRLLSKIIDRRCQIASAALVTKIEFNDWVDYSGGPPLAMALLERGVDGAIIRKADDRA